MANNTESAVCFSFYYHMYGLNIKTLNVYNGDEVIWTKSGDQGDAWHKAEVTIIGDFDVSEAF